MDMIKKTLTSLILSCALLGYTAYAMSPSAYQYYLSANYYISIKQPEKAIEEYKKAIEVSPSDAMLYLKMAGVYNDMGNWQKAVEIYKKATIIKPDDAFIYVSIGNILQQNNDYKGAKEAYLKSYTISPSYKYNLYNIANVSLMLKENKDAEIYYTEFLKSYPDHNEARKNLASIYIEKEDYKNAIENFKYIFKKNPRDFKDYYIFSYALMKDGDYKNAIEGFKQEIKQNPNNANAYANLAISYINTTPSNPKSALTCFERAFSLGGDFEKYRFDYANLLASNDKISEALEQYQKYLEKYQTNDNAYLNVGIIQLKNKKYDIAIDNFQKAININSNNLDAKKQLALAYQLKGDAAKANQLYDELLVNSANDAEVLFNAGLSFEKTKNYQKAIDALEKSLAIKSDNEIKTELANCYANYAASLLDKQNYEEAKTYYEKSLRYNSDNLSAHSGLAYYYQKQGNHEKSTELFEKVISSSTKNEYDFVAYGNSLNALNKTEEAIGAFNKALELNSNLASAHEGLGDTYLKLQMQEKARKEYETATKCDNSTVNANIKLGNLYKENLENEKALECYNKALQIDGNNTLALYNKAVSLFDMNKLNDAKNVYYKLISINDEFAMSYYGLGIIAEKEKNYREAISQYNKFTELTDNTTLKNTIQRRISLLKSRI